MATSVRDAEPTSTEDAGLGMPMAGAVLLGLGLGGFFDGIVLHQLLQWHHMGTSAGFPPDSVENLKLNTVWDGAGRAALVGLDARCLRTGEDFDALDQALYKDFYGEEDKRDA